MPNVVQGSCRCGETTFEVAAEPLITSACHCRGCQQMSASAYSLTALVPAHGFRVTKGEPVIGGLKDPQQQHHFCPACLSWMFTQIEGAPFVNVRSVLLEGGAYTEPFLETMTREKLAWVQTPAQRSYQGFPPEEAFGELLAAYAEYQGG